MSANRISKALGERFTFTIKNTSGATKTVALLAAFFATLAVVSAADGSPATVKYTDASAIVGAGYACDAVADDGVIIDGVTVTPANPKFSYRQFREYIKCQGKQLIDMSVQANNVAAFNSVIEVVKCSPLQGSAPQSLPLTEFRSVDQTSTDKVNVNNINMDMDFDTLMMLPIQDGHEITISFKFN